MDATTIDPKDLCIGSYVQDDSGELLIVKAIDEKRIDVQVVGDPDQCYFYPPETLFAVSITPEWLEKLGFQMIADYHGPKKLIQCAVVVNGAHRYEIAQYALTDSWWLNPPGQLYLRGKKLIGIHHLQSLIWQLERHWLTLSPETP